MRFELLGGVRGWAGQQPVSLGVRKQRLVLAVLALDVNAVVPVHRLVDVLWPDSPPTSARAMVHTYISGLRQILEPHGIAVARESDGYVLRCRPDDIDVHEFRRLLAAAGAQTGDETGHETADERRVERLGAALALWQGPPLAGVVEEPVRARLALHLEEARLAAIEDRAAAMLRLGRHRAVADDLVTLAGEYPERQRLTGHLMLALHGDGRTAEALRWYERLRSALAEELGVDPDVELRRLHRQILREGGASPSDAPGGGADGDDAPRHDGPQHDGPQHDGLRHDGPRHDGPRHDGPRHDGPRNDGRRAPATAPVPRQLPAAPAFFVGRDSEMDQLDRLCVPAAGVPGTSVPPTAAITAPPIVAITGTAGVGKTALAVNWAHRAAGEYPDGQLFVNLRGHSAAAPLAAAEALALFLRAFGVPAERIPTDAEESAALYRSSLAGRRVLVLLDNAATAEQVRPLLPGDAGCAVLVTSRTELAGLAALDGARLLGIGMLAPDASLDLLGGVLGADRVTGEAASAAELATLCGHLPLALRIAAANLATRPGESLDRQVARLRGDRLASLAVEGDPSASVSATFDLSYAALSEPGRRLFRLLSLVPGVDVTAPVAASLSAVDGADPDVEAAGRELARLATAHLLEEPVPDRFQTHDLLRRYAAGRAEALEPPELLTAARDRLYDYYLRATIATSSGTPAPPGAPAGSGGLVPPPHFATAAEGQAWLDAERPNLLAAARHAASLGAAGQDRAGDDRARDDRAGDDRAGDDRAGDDRARDDNAGPVEFAWRLLEAARLHLVTRTPLAVWLPTAEATLAAARDAGDRSGTATMHNLLGAALRAHSDFTAAQRHLQQALSLYSQAGDARGIAGAHNNLGTVNHDQGRIDEAIRHYRDALDASEAHGDPRLTATSTLNLGLAHHQRGDLVDVERYLVRALAQQDGLGDARIFAGVQVSLAELYLDTGRYDLALQHAEVAIQSAVGAGDLRVEARSRMQRAEVLRELGRYEESLAECAQARTVAGRIGMPMVEAFTLAGYAETLLHAGRVAESLATAESALRLVREHGLARVEGQALRRVAAARLASGDPDGAADAAGAGLRLHRRLGQHLDGARTLAVLGDARSAAGDAAGAQECWREALRTFERAGCVDAGTIRTRLAGSAAR